MASLSSVAGGANQPTTFSGFNGFDFGSIINSIIQQESQPMQNTQSQQQAAQTKGTALNQLGGYISTLETTVGSLTDGTAFSGVVANTSDATTVATTLGDGAIPGHYDINIDHLARAQVTTATNGYATTSTTAADGGSISFTVNGTTTTPISVTSTTTLGQLTGLINDQNSGVVASIVNDGTNQRLVISSRTTGQKTGFTINNSLTNSAGAPPAFAVGQGATSGNTQNGQDAAFTMNNLSITSPTNAVNSAIPGVTLTLAKPGEASVDVIQDDSALKGTLTTLVSNYNTLQRFFTSQSGSDPATGNPMPLSNDPALQQAMSDITNTLLGANSNSGAYKYLSQIGLEFTTSGSLSFVETSFDSAMATNPQDVQNLMQGLSGGSGATGVFNKMTNLLHNDDATSGLIKQSEDGLTTTIKNYQDQLTQDQQRLNARRTQLTQMYAAADQAMTQLNQETSSLSSIAGR